MDLILVLDLRLMSVLGLNWKWVMDTECKGLASTKGIHKGAVWNYTKEVLVPALQS